MESNSSCPVNGCNMAHIAADLAVKKAFGILGVDVDVPKEVEEFREDLRFGRAMRTIASRGVIAFVVVAAGGLAVALWMGLKIKIVGH